MSSIDDSIDSVRDQWRSIVPELDTSPMSITGRIRVLSHAIQAGSDEVLARHGLTRADFDILSVLVRSGRPLSPTEITSQSLVSAPGTTKRLKKMTLEGLIERTENPLDRRGSLIKPTQKALAVFEPILESLSRYERDLLAQLGPRHIIQLTESLREFTSVVQAAGPRPTGS
ncbi:MarR family winged helix-turn-helix transcriptional regulator [Paeniglutamicibacter sp. ORCA_105]|uniref:MarR family winged helix-turn-helix transcriptional regulator n=1 Tax=Paeniglutamicibacter sp. ORCA_105 TaxID=3377336 RepID=UPI0038960333